MTLKFNHLHIKTKKNIHILEQTVVSGGRRVCFFEGPDGVQLEFIEMKKS